MGQYGRPNLALAGLLVNQPHLHLAPPSEWSRSNFANIFGSRKLEFLGYRVTLLAWL